MRLTLLAAALLAAGCTIERPFETDQRRLGHRESHLGRWLRAEPDPRAERWRAAQVRPDPMELLDQTPRPMDPVRMEPLADPPLRTPLSPRQRNIPPPPKPPAGQNNVPAPSMPPPAPGGTIRVPVPPLPPGLSAPPPPLTPAPALSAADLPPVAGR